ncbi:MAG: YjbH domain-containing protein [Imperialibacter sp.]|uniref:YjbH domain-containing protein n=1 Tax=Imperialibacter sp. TaxID=2038411 RepID=UPI0032ED45AF
MTNLSFAEIRMNIGFLFTSILLFAATEQQCHAQFTLTGQAGNFLVPEARVIGDKQIAFGSSFHPKPEALLLYTDRQGSHEIYNYLTLGFLPFMDITINLASIIHAPIRSGIGDRSATVRFLLKKETNTFPAILLGTYAPLGTNEFVESNFLVATKNLAFAGKRLAVTGGFGTPWVIRTPLYEDFDSFTFFKKKTNYQVGLMMAARWELTEHLLVAAEYDGNKFNAGLMARFFKEKCFAKVYTFNFKTVGFGVSYSGVVR